MGRGLRRHSRCTQKAADFAAMPKSARSRQVIAAHRNDLKKAFYLQSVCRLIERAHAPGDRRWLANFDGPIGWLAAKVMGYMNAEAEAEAIELLAASAGERLLVRGFGPGLGLEILARLCPDTMITGVDPSASMLRSAVQRNRAAISAGKMTLHQTTVAGLEASACGFDASVAVHTLQFFEPLEDEAIALANDCGHPDVW